uniref:Uncharacterized protein n=1 Tax=Heterorhabditis bacteriophora TaxID=37862 RepID=A0A1I7WG26_HETBA
MLLATGLVEVLSITKEHQHWWKAKQLIESSLEEIIKVSIRKNIIFHVILFVLHLTSPNQF